VLVSLGKNIEASVLTTMALKDLENRTIIAKAKNAIHGEILAKIGATKIVYPEREMAKKIVRDISRKMLLETFDISNSFKGVKFLPPPVMVGKKAGKLDLEKHGIRLVAIRTKEEWLQEFGDTVIGADTHLFCTGDKKAVGTFISELLG
jgi:trk system potassium uptake protein